MTLNKYVYDKFAFCFYKHMIGPLKEEGMVGVSSTEICLSILQCPSIGRW